MAIRDEVKEQQKKLEGKTWKDKLNYFWYYYKIHTIAVIFALFLIGIFIKDSVTAKDYAFSAILLNAYGSDKQEAFQEDFAEYADIDTGTYNCYIDTTSTLSYDTMSQMDLAVMQRIIAMAETGEIDVMISNEENFNQYSSSMMFIDLREVLPAAEYKKYESDFYYIDAAIFENDDEIIYDENGIPQSTDTVSDHTDPSAMEDPMPVGIYLKDSAKLKEWACYTGIEGSPVFGFNYSSERKDVAHLFLKYLTE